MNDTGVADTGLAGEYGRPPIQTIDFLMVHFRLQGLLDDLIGTRSREFGLATTEALALMSLTKGTSTVSGISSTVGVKKSTGSVMVDRLRARRLIRRQRSRRDHRVVTVELTDAGRDIAQALCEQVPHHVGAMLSSVPEREIAALIQTLARVTGITPQTPSPPLAE